MKRILFFAGILILVLAVTVSIAAAQGNGPGNTGGSGNGNGGGPPQGQGDGPVTNMGINCSGNGMVTGTHTGMMNQNSDEAPSGHTHMWQEESFGAGYFAGLPPAVAGELSDAVIAMMNAGIMDEYNAYAIYQCAP